MPDVQSAHMAAARASLAVDADPAHQGAGGQSAPPSTSCFSRYLPSLQRWARGRLPVWARNLADTQDLVQDTLCETLKHVDGFEHRGHRRAARHILRQSILNRIRNELKRAASPAGHHGSRSRVGLIRIGRRSRRRSALKRSHVTMPRWHRLSEDDLRARSWRGWSWILSYAEVAEEAYPTDKPRTPRGWRSRARWCGSRNQDER